jgi:hypothetical protein
MIRVCVVLDGQINILEMVNCDQKKRGADNSGGYWRSRANLTVIRKLTD